MPSQFNYQLLAIGGLLLLVAWAVWYVSRLNLYLLHHSPGPGSASRSVPRIVAQMKLAARLAALFTAAIACFVLLGWSLRSPRMVSIIPGLVAMNPVVAASLIASAISLWLLIDGSPRTSQFAKAIGTGVALIALIKLAGFLLGHDTRIDQILFSDRLDLLPNLDPNRMAPNTALGLLLLGTALSVLDITTRRGRRPAEMLAIAAALIAILGLVGYLYNVTALYHVKTFIPMAVHTAACLLTLSAGILFSRPDLGMMSIVSSDTDGGVTARKLLPAAILVPVALGWLRAIAQHRGGLNDIDFGISLVILGNIFFFVLLIWATAGLLRQSDSHRRHIEQSLGQERNVLRGLIDNLPDHIYVKDAAGRYITDNIAHAKFVGLAGPHEVAGKTVADFFPPQVAARFTADDNAVVASGEALLAREEPIVDHEGNPKWVATTKVALRDPSGAVTGLVCISRDITRRKLAEQQMQEMQDFLSSIIENLPDMIFVKDAADLRYLRFNRAGEEMLGFKRENLIGKTNYDLFPKAVADSYDAADRAALEGGKLLDIPQEPIQTPDGTLILHTKKIPLFFNGKASYLLGISEDITEEIKAQKLLHAQNVRLQEMAESERHAHEELKRAQGQMLQTEKLAALGELVAGVAHEINNPLSFVSNNVAVLQRDVKAIRELLEMYQKADAAIQAADAKLMAEIRELCDRLDLVYTLTNLDDMMNRSRDGLKRIQQIVKDLRDFARLDESDLHEVDLNQGVESTVNIIRGRAKSKKVAIELDLHPLPPIACYPAKINQVIMNLVANAIDACPSDGTVTIRTNSTETNGVQIDVIDTGSGIDPAIRAKIFDPFFTTKPQGEGTGLGLSISYGIIRDHHGNIEVDSTVGKGSRFTITLPRNSMQREKTIHRSEMSS